MERGTVQIKNFDREWAIPTYELLRPLLIALAFALAFPYLPGADSDAIKGVSIFLGVLLSFGSSSAVANVMAGVVLLYSRAFHVGDWVRIGDQEGAVISRGLLVTRIRTAKNVDISVPSAVVLNGHIHNYTAQAAEGLLILHATVTIGYDAPWRTVHELLIAAAKATTHILPLPAPFVLQTALGDFNVSYQINAFTRRAELQPDDLFGPAQEHSGAVQRRWCRDHVAKLPGAPRWQHGDDPREAAPARLRRPVVPGDEGPGVTTRARSVPPLAKLTSSLRLPIPRRAV